MSNLVTFDAIIDNYIRECHGIIFLINQYISVDCFIFKHISMKYLSHYSSYAQIQQQNRYRSIRQFPAGEYAQARLEIPWHTLLGYAPPILNDQSARSSRRFMYDTYIASSQLTLQFRNFLWSEVLSFILPLRKLLLINLLKPIERHVPSVHSYQMPIQFITIGLVSKQNFTNPCRKIQ